jgi:hypothetical protein
MTRGMLSNPIAIKIISFPMPTARRLWQACVVFSEGGQLIQIECINTINIIGKSVLQNTLSL